MKLNRFTFSLRTLFLAILLLAGCVFLAVANSHHLAQGTIRCASCSAEEWARISSSARTKDEGVHAILHKHLSQLDSWGKDDLHNLHHGAFSVIAHHFASPSGDRRKHMVFYDGKITESRIRDDVRIDLLVRLTIDKALTNREPTLTEAVECRYRGTYRDPLVFPLAQKDGGFVLVIVTLTRD